MSDKIPTKAEIENLQARIVGSIMAFERDFPNHLVQKIHIHHREQTIGGPRYVDVVVVLP